MTSEQVSEWMAYDSIDPVGKQRDDYGWAMICSVIYNLVLDIYSVKGSHPKRTTPIDFMPDWGNTREKAQKIQTVDEQKSILSGLARRRKKEKKHG